MDQLESSIKTLEESYEDDPDRLQHADPGGRAGERPVLDQFFLFGGRHRGQPAGFYFIHYQKTQEGLLTANIYSDRASNSEAIQRLVSTIQLETENAQDYPTGQSSAWRSR